MIIESCQARGRADLPKCPRILPPHEVELSRHDKQKSGEVGQRQVEQVDVGGGPHVLVLDDYQAGGEVTKDAKDQEHAGNVNIE